MSVSTSSYIQKQKKLSERLKRRYYKKQELSESLTTTNSTTTNCTLTSLLLDGRLYQSPTTIVVTNLSNAGTTASISSSALSNDVYGKISISVSGTITGGDKELCSIQLTKSYTTAIVLIRPVNAITSSYNLWGDVVGDVITVYINTTPSASQQLSFNYLVLGS